MFTFKKIFLTISIFYCVCFPSLDKELVVQKQIQILVKNSTVMSMSLFLSHMHQVVLNELEKWSESER